EAALARVEHGLGRRYKSAHDPAAAVAASLEGLDLRVGVPEGAEAALVIEAVPEEPKLKADILASAEAAFPKGVLASNTSSPSIDGLAQSLSDPSRFIGMHF